MRDPVQLTSNLLLEYTNGAFFVLSIYAAFIFGRYIWVNKDNGYYFIRPAIPFFFVFFTEGLLRGPYWMTRHWINEDLDVHVSPGYVIVVSALITGSILCAIRVYSPDSWGNKSWVVALVLTIAVLLGSLLF